MVFDITGDRKLTSKNVKGLKTHSTIHASAENTIDTTVNADGATTN